MPRGIELTFDGPSFYDDKGVFARYQQMRGRPDAPHRTIESPKLLAFLGDLRGRTVLDLGCGDAWIGRYALDQGAVCYLGLDASQRMLNEARRMLRGSVGEVRLQNLESWRSNDIGMFDTVVSRLAFQYVENLPRLFDVIRQHLKPSGLFVFSIEHPLITANYDGNSVESNSDNWRVKNYFREGVRVHHWLDSVVRKHHRTVDTYLNEIRRSGFQLDQFSEGRPDAELFVDRQKYEGHLDWPMCAIFRCIKHT